MEGWPTNCTLTPSTDEGPYWVDERLERADVTEGQRGTPISLEIRVFQFAPSRGVYEGAAVDIWHANALGLYSDERDQPREDTSGETFLRGYQVSDTDGEVRFRTIYPGWYEGRTPHIHVRVRTFADDEVTYSFTTQIFFDETVNETVLATSPYDERPDRDTTNATDDIFDSELV